MPERHGPLVACETLFEHLDDEDWVVFDCRHELLDPQAGPLAYAASHIPGAFHAHVDQDLSDPVGDGERGRHPLPDADRFAAFLRRHGVSRDTQVVAYDEGPGHWAARVWWLLRDLGHDGVAVLDGGLAHWRSLQLPLDDGNVTPPDDGDIDADPGHMPRVETEEVEAHVAAPADLCLVDVRAAERYEGHNEPIDPVAGHIPGAVNRPYTGSLEPTGVFLSPDELRARYEELPGRLVMYCGSGVTASHGVLAGEVAGLGTPALYPGSWSAWCHASAERPVERSQDAPAR